MKRKKSPSKSVNIRGVINSFKLFYSLISSNNIRANAALASYYLLTSLIPFIMLFISATQSFFPQAVDELFDFVSEYIPYSLRDFIIKVKSEIISGGVFPILSISALTALWSSSRSISTLIREVSVIYDAGERAGFFRNLMYSLACTVILIFLICFALTTLVFGDVVKDIILFNFPSFEFVFSILFKIRGTAFFVFLTFSFALFYYIVSRSLSSGSSDLCKFVSQLPGAVFTASGWIVFSLCYSLYLEYFPQSNYLYGGLAAITLLQFWIYFCVFILLIGAQINKILSN